MLDRDLAELYGVEVSQLNRQVKRNIERFPDDFMFQLTREECSRCQIGILNGSRGSNIKYLPYALVRNEERFKLIIDAMQDKKFPPQKEIKCCQCDNVANCQVLFPMLRAA